MPDPTTYNDLAQRPARNGIIPLRKARMIAFGIVTTTIVACTVLSLLAIWDRMASDVLWRALATVVVVIVATGLFTVINEHFGRQE